MITVNSDRRKAGGACISRSRGAKDVPENNNIKERSESKMERDYAVAVQKRENLYRAYINKAQLVLQTNKGKHTSEECQYLQRAAELQSEMADMTIGEERNHHLREKENISHQVLSILREIDPQKAEAFEKGKSDGKTPQTAGGKGGDSDKEKLDNMAKGWHKEAPNHSFANVSGMAELKDKLSDCVTNSNCEALLDFLKIPRLNTYFFVGPPGCGKTYIIEAFANELVNNQDKEYQFLSLVGSDIISRYVGDAEKIVTRMFEEAENSAPCILFIDEIDGVCRNRAQKSMPEYAASITTSFLTGYNRMKNSGKSIVFIGATNYPQRVDSAMLDRAEVIRVPLPDREARSNAFRMSFDGIITLEEGLCYDDMAAVTDGYNYRDIERVTSIMKKDVFEQVMKKAGNENAAIDLIKNGSFKLSRTVFETAMAGFKPSSKKDILDAIDKWERNLSNDSYLVDDDME